MSDKDDEDSVNEIDWNALPEDGDDNLDSAGSDNPVALNDNPAAPDDDFDDDSDDNDNDDDDNDDDDNDDNDNDDHRI